MPGDVRNDLYLTLEKAEFERGGKSTAKNVLATVTVHDSTGQVISVSSFVFLFSLYFVWLIVAVCHTLR